MAFLCIGAASANDINTTSDDNSLMINQESVLEDIEGDDVDTSSQNQTSEDAVENVSSQPISTSYKVSSQETFMKGSEIDVRILDSNNSAVANKTVYLDYRGNQYVRTTDEAGHVYLKFQATGTNTLTITFNETGYVPIKATKQVTVVSSSKTAFKASNYVAYVGVKNPFTATLKANGVPLPGKKVTIKINGKKYTKTTNKNGQFSLNINLKKGTYTLKMAYGGWKFLNSCSKSVKITVKKGMPVKISKANSVVYVHKTSNPFKIKLVDSRGNPVAKKNFVFNVYGYKKYHATTNADGIAKFTVKLPMGVYSILSTSPKTGTYNKATTTFKIKVISNKCTNDGMWLFGSDMKSVNLKKVSGYGIKHIFLNYYAVDSYGADAVADFAKQANSNGIKVHIWMQAFNNGKWISPVYKNGTYKYTLFNSIIKKAKSYAAIEGVSGIHFDYLRFPGTAYKYKNAAKAINYFTKQACNALHKQNSKLIVSAAVMPEVSANKYYYGQDIPTLSKYLDVIVPMIYKGNYGQSASWIKSVTAAFVKQSNGAQIWAGLQGYKSDSNVKKLSSSEISNDAFYASLGGATGVMLFRYTLFNFFDMTKV